MFKLYDKVKTDKGLTLEVIRITPDAVTLRFGLMVYIFEKTNGAIDGSYHANAIGKLLPPSGTTTGRFETIDGSYHANAIGKLLPPEHPHAALMLEYAKDWAETDTPWERWQLQKLNGEWHTLAIHHGHPKWDKHTEYRRKPKVITINGHEVPEPYRGDLRPQVSYYTAQPSDLELCYEWRITSLGVPDELERLQELGLMHTTKEAAIAHAKALLSFTAK